MKQFIIFLFCISFSFYTNAQPGDYAGPAKLSVTTFWTQAENMRAAIEKGAMNSAQGKVSMLERAIATTKTKDPSYRTGSMESELTKLKELCAAKDKELKDGHAEKKEKLRNRIKVGDMLESLFSNTLVRKMKFQTGPLFTSRTAQILFDHSCTRHR